MSPVANLLRIVLFVGLSAFPLHAAKVKITNNSTNTYSGGNFKIHRNGASYWTPFSAHTFTPGYTATSSESSGLDGYTVTVLRDETGTENDFWLAPTNGLAGSSGAVLEFTILAEPDVCSTNICIVNPFLSGVVLAYWQVDGVLDPDNAFYAERWLFARESACTNLTYDCDIPSAVKWGYRYGDPEVRMEWDGSEWNPVVDTTPKDVPLQGVGGQGGTNPPPYLPELPRITPDEAATNSPIAWGSSTNLDEIMRAGFGGLLSGQQDQLKQGGLMLDQLSKIRRESGVYVTVTNSIDVSGITSHLGAIHLSLTGHLDWATSSVASATSSLLTAIFSSTNAFNELGGPALFGSASNFFESARANFGEPDESPGVGTALQFTAVGHTWDMNPLSRDWGVSIFGLIKSMFKWLLAAAYTLAVLRRIMDVVKSLGTAQQGSAPDLELSVLGSGGNLAALLAAVIVPLILALFAGALAWAGTAIAGVVSGDVAGALTTNPLSGYGGAVGVGINLARHAFPFAFAFGLFFAYLTWYASTLAIISLINVSMRFIWGD